MIRTLLAALSNAIEARANCIKSGNEEWSDRHEDRANAIIADYMPSGSGFDTGTKLDWDKTRRDRIVLRTSFHHMAASGMYDGWTGHSVIVTPTFGGFHVHVTGRNRNGIKDYIGDTFAQALDVTGDYEGDNFKRAKVQS